MTLQRLHGIVLTLGNSGYVRFWVHRNHPQNPAKMAIQVMDYQATGVWDDDGNEIFEIFAAKVDGIEKEGFQVEDDNVHGKHWIYTIERTNEDGTPFISTL